MLNIIKYLKYLVIIYGILYSSLFSQTNNFNNLINSFNTSQNSNNSNFDVTFYSLDLDIYISQPYIEGNVLCRFKSVIDSLQEIKLNLIHTFDIDSVVGNVNNYIFKNDTIYITFNKTILIGEESECKIYYRGKPQPAENNIGFQYESSNGIPKITTACEPFFSYCWWPCKDGAGDKADSVYIDITIPDTVINGVELIALSNGKLDNIISKTGKKTFQWRERYPIATYYIMAAVSNYEHFRIDYTGKYGEKFPIDFWVFPGNVNAAQGFVSRITEVIDFYSSLFGKYPFHKEKYAMTQVSTNFGALENQTNTIMWDDWWRLSQFRVLVHELSHMWFGCMISFENLHNVWLNEGFASYCEALWREKDNGFEAYKNYMKKFEYWDGGTVYLKNVPGYVWDIFNSDLQYHKAAYSLHMLRGVLGDSLFFKCIYEYANQKELMYDHVITDQFKNVCENVSQMNLDFFFDQWIYDEYYPVYEYSFDQNQSTFDLNIQIEQTQSNNGWRSIFEMPIQLKLIYEDNSDTTITVWNNKQKQNFNIALSKNINNIEFDPDNWILKKVKRVSTGIVENILNKLPIKFSLFQNYPNPFNPSTTIKYSIPQQSYITLKIYDILGRQVATVIDEVKPPGNYQVEFNAANLPSGVYFYRIQAGSFNQVRKMLLIK